MQSVKTAVNDLNQILIQPLICSIYKFTANVMTAKDAKESKLTMHYKQYLNSFHDVEEMIKKLKNDKSEINRIVSMCNNLNGGGVIKDIDRNGPIRFTWEANHHGEKIMQLFKELFVNQKDDFEEIMINKFYAKKVLDHLSPEESIKSAYESKFRAYNIESRETL